MARELTGNISREATAATGNILSESMRQMQENSASRAKPPKFIGGRRSDFRCDGAYLGQFGLRIMNPPL